ELQRERDQARAADRAHALASASGLGGGASVGRSAPATVPASLSFKRTKSHTGPARKERGSSANAGAPFSNAAWPTKFSTQPAVQLPFAIHHGTVQRGAAS